MKSTTSLVLLRSLDRVKIRVKVRVKVTMLLYQIGFTTLLDLKREKIFHQQASSSSKQQAATELISAYPHISINTDGTSPKLSWYIVLMMPYNHTKFQVKTHQGAGSVGKKV